MLFRNKNVTVQLKKYKISTFVRPCPASQRLPSFLGIKDMSFLVGSSTSTKQGMKAGTELPSSKTRKVSEP